MSKKLSGMVALVTGGSRGIGAAIAKRLAQDGAAVAITYASSSSKADEVVAAIEAEGGRALAVHADSADADAVKNAVAETAKVLGGLDILVNNAGVAIMKPFDEFTLDEFDHLVNINVRGVFVGIQEASRHMRDGGRIITIGSVNGDRVPFPGGSVYALTKAAVAGLTRGLARDLGPRGITVNNVQPGPVNTELNPENGPFAEMLKGIMALPRYGKDDEVASLVAFLASPEAAFITGASIDIDGGFKA
ncbi:MAG TPA: 3-oxoacyl-ACP reductase family protein [Acidobacteriota bacterium]|nr:3-oxoacyl-ACP reductase family protein [Acidobacteriota bacterium]